MQGVEIGPLVFSGPRFAAITGIIVFLVVTEIMARARGPAFRRWSGQVVIGGILAARLGFVALHWPDFLADPASVLYLWQGGFSLVAAGVGVAGISLFHLWRRPQDAAMAGLALASAMALANVAFQISGDAAATALPPTAFATLAGDPVILSDRGGRPLVVNLWATWCPPCRRELPMMAEVAAGLTDVDMVFANQGEGPVIVERFLAREGLAPGTVVIDSGQDLYRHYGALGLPATLFIGADGRLQDAHLGKISRSQLNAGIARLKGQP
ncbi:TlpA disulfide reductase family protein [Paracoccaceae bacterium Fryx2]|nr:TlpA disulfide reductase family protein [Paracoccaceae bacterium Fryx2]